MRFALDREPASLDPAEVREWAGVVVVDAVFDSLARMSDNLAVAQPSAAAEWESSPDLRTWTFRLREDGRWHDGTPVVASDFVRAFEALSPALPEPVFNAWLLEPLVHNDGELDLRTRGDLTLVVTLPEPMGDLPALLSHPALAPRQPGGFDSEQPVGNGPFRLAEPWAHNQFVRLAPVEEASEQLVDEVLLPIYAQQGGDEIQYADFQAEAVDVAGLPPDRLDEARLANGSGVGNRGPGVLTGDLATLHYLGYDTSRSPWSDPDVRRAVSLLIDRDVLVAQVGGDVRSAAQGIVPPGLPGAGVAVCDHCDRDLADSLDLLGAAEVVPDEPVRLLTPDDPANLRVATVAANSIEDGLEVPVEVDARPLREYAVALEAGDFDLFLASWTPGRPSMGGMLEPMLSSSSSRLDNPGRVAVDEVDAALARAESLASPTQRLAAWQDAEHAALDAAVVAPLYVPRARLVVEDDVTGFLLRPDGIVDLTEVDVPPEE